MYVITNREINIKRPGLGMFGDKPSSNGAQDLRMMSVNHSGNSWKVTGVRDKLTKPMVQAINRKFGFKLDTNKVWPGSLKVACDLFDQAQSSDKSILFFVHGYNNDIKDVLLAAEAIESLYGVIVVPFSWPANGGGFLTGTASYKSDKADARQSSSALNRVVGKIKDYHAMLTAGNTMKLKARANTKHPHNAAAAQALFTKLQRKACKSRISLLCHSMGNYVFKHTLKTGDSVTRDLVFDNVCLVAADTNNENHREWVGKVDTRKRCYIVINEDDSALMASRIKPGAEQLARLGHYLRKLDSENALYINVTGVKAVGSEHTYFKGESVQKNEKLAVIFDRMFKGKSIEDLTYYQADSNSYVLK